MLRRFHNVWPHHTASTPQPSLEHLLRGGRGGDGGCAHSLGTLAWCRPGTATSRASRSRSEGSSLLRRVRRCHGQGSSARPPGESQHRGSAPLGGWGLRGAGGAAISPSATEVLQAAVWEEAGAAVAPAPALLPSQLPLTAWCPPCSAAPAPPGPQRLWPAAGAERCPPWRGCEQPAPWGQLAAWGCSGAGEFPCTWAFLQVPAGLRPWEPAGWALCSWRWAGSGWAVVAWPGWCDSSVAVLGTRAGPQSPCRGRVGAGDVSRLRGEM